MTGGIGVFVHHEAILVLMLVDVLIAESIIPLLLLLMVLIIVSIIRFILFMFSIITKTLLLLTINIKYKLARLNIIPIRLTLQSIQIVFFLHQNMILFFIIRNIRIVLMIIIVINKRTIRSWTVLDRNLHDLLVVGGEDDEVVAFVRL